MLAPHHPLDGRPAPRRRSTRCERRDSTRLTDCLNASAERSTGTDSAWALRLKDAVDCAVRELGVEVRSAKAVLCQSDSEEMVFELDTNRGRLRAIRTVTGRHHYRWL